MEFVRLKYANNKLIDSNIREHREVINEYVEKKGYEYVGFIPIVFSPNGKPMVVDLVFKKPVEHAPKIVLAEAEKIERPVKPVRPPVPVKPAKPEPVEKKHDSTPAKSNDLYNDRGLDLILNGDDDDLIGEGK